MPLTGRLPVALVALALAGCGAEQHAARPPAPKLPEQAVSDAPGLIAVPRLRQAPPVRPLPVARPRSHRAIVRHRAPRVRVVPQPASRVVARTAAVPVPVQRPLPQPRSHPARPPIVFDDSG